MAMAAPPDYAGSSSVRLFGVCLPPPPSAPSSSSSSSSSSILSPPHSIPGIRKCISLLNISSSHLPGHLHPPLPDPPPSSSVAEPPHSSHLGAPHSTAVAAASPASAPSGYLSDCLLHNAAVRLRERKKGVPWTEDEHRLFLMGLQKLGKGDWRGIAKNFVITRTPTQVASHAQKYFLRQCNLNKRKRRSSLFDIISDPSNMQAALNQVCPQSSSPPNIYKPSSGTTHYHHPHQNQAAEVAELNSASPTSPPSISAALAPMTRGEAAATESLIRSPDFCFGGLPNPWHRRSAAAESERNAFPQPPIRAFITDVPVSASKMRLPSSLSPTPSWGSSASSLCRVDEAVELSSLNLTIAPPCSPSLFTDTKHHSADVSLNMLQQPPRSFTALVQPNPATPSAAAAAAMVSSPNTNSPMAKAIIAAV